MTAEQVKNTVTYLYLKSELKKIAKAQELSEIQVCEIEKDIKVKLSLTNELCWM